MTPRRRQAPAGAIVGLYLDTEHEIARGDYVRTTTGRTYRVREARVQQTGTHAGRRWILDVEVLGYRLIEDLIVTARIEGRVVHPLRWYRRSRRRG